MHLIIIFVCFLQDVLSSLKLELSFNVCISYVLHQEGGALPGSAGKDTVTPMVSIPIT